MTNFLNPDPASGQSGGVATQPLVFASSNALDSTSMKRVKEADTVGNETRIVLERINATLAEAGCSLRDVVKTTCYISDWAHQGGFRSAYTEAFEPGRYPGALHLQAGFGRRLPGPDRRDRRAAGALTSGPIGAKLRGLRRIFRRKGNTICRDR